MTDDTHMSYRFQAKSQADAIGHAHMNEGGQHDFQACIDMSSWRQMVMRKSVAELREYAFKRREEQKQVM